MLKILRHKGSIINLRYFGGLLTEQVLINISGPLLESEPVYGFSHGHISVLENAALFTGYQSIHTQGLEQANIVGPFQNVGVITGMAQHKI